MRYYDVRITDSQNNIVNNWHWSTLNSDGSMNANALLVDFDVLVYSSVIEYGQSTVTIHGVSLTDLKNANNMHGLTLTVSAGMAPGLPLATDLWRKSGVIFKGTIFQSVGNWIGTDMSITWLLTPTATTLDTPGNYVLNWNAGQKLSDALSQTFSVALPNLGQDINISPDIVSPMKKGSAVFTATTLHQLASFIDSWTLRHAPNSGFVGVNIGIAPSGTATSNKSVVKVWDGTNPPSPIQIQFEELIGQPVWYSTYQMEFISPMRADITMGDMVQMPQGLEDLPGIVETSTSAFPSVNKYRSLFTGQFFIVSARYLGNSRSPDGTQWAVTYKCIPYG